MDRELDIVGRAALLWRLERDGAESIDCIAGELADRRYRVRVLRGGWEQAAETFPDPADGVRWALEIERSFVEQGWTKLM